MLFNSLAFVVFFPLATAAYFLTPARWRWVVLLVSSYVFYMWWRADFALLILFSTVVDYLAARVMAESENRNVRTALLITSLASNLGLLFFFKYLTWAVGEANALLGWAGAGATIPELDLLLPVGISFYTFQTLSYTIDVYRGKCPPEKHFGRFAVYVSFWPQLVAGPIERAVHLLPQLRAAHAWDTARAVDGLKQMIWGLFKKVVIADRLAIYVDAVYADPDGQGGWALMLATYLFAFQIYTDFSGYSDIAIGAARIMGIDLMENFKRPYFARSVSEFWRRWHISLSTWFRDYLYIPLGGNRVGVPRWYANLLIVFVVSGFWHGANWTFIVWGALHGLYLISGILTDEARGAIEARVPWLATWPRILWTFHLALLAWVFFRADSVQDAGLVLYKVAMDLPALGLAVVSLDVRAVYQAMVVSVGVTQYDFVLCILGVVVLFGVDLARERGWRLPETTAGHLGRYVAYDLLIVAMLLFGAFGQRSFIYFQF